MDTTGLSGPVQELLSQPYHGMDLVCARKTPEFAARALREAQPSVWFPDAPHPNAALAGLWLRFGGWERAHEIAQDLPSAEGSYWHAIVHRQEPDAWNSSYWFRRVRSHPIFDPLLKESMGLLEKNSKAGFELGREWDPFAFVDFCESVRQNPDSHGAAYAKAVQEAEWRLLFRWCAVRR